MRSLDYLSREMLAPLKIMQKPFPDGLGKNNLRSVFVFRGIVAPVKIKQKTFPDGLGKTKSEKHQVFFRGILAR